jgi:uncharacterized protein YcfJ
VSYGTTITSDTRSTILLVKNLTFVAILAVPCLALHQGKAQSNDWQAVKAIAPGAPISVRVLGQRRWRECELMNATDSELTCVVRRRLFEKQISVPRPKIHEVRLEHPEQDRTIIGAVIGGAAGAVVGGIAASRTSDPEAKVAAPVLGIFLGACFGGGAGRAIHLHGPVIYIGP